MLRCYERQSQLFEAIKRIGKRPLPAYAEKEPGLYLLCRENADGLTIGIWNFGSDFGMPERIRLARKYREISGIGGTRVSLAGDAAVLDGVIPPFGFAGFRVR